MITGTSGDTTHLHKIYRMSLIVPLCQSSFDHHHLVQLEEELLKYGGVVTSGVATFYPVS